MTVPAPIPSDDSPATRSRRSTVTARFGSSRRESHDASPFYERFTPPRLSTEGEVERHPRKNALYQLDARDMSKVDGNSVALVVTSPPYFAGKEYEEELGREGVPGTYFEYLAMLTDVFRECERVLEPGGRIAVNVANLGRRPYRSLSSDVIHILEELGLLLRGEVIWWKGRRAGGSCAWGSFQRPANPVLRDVTERIVIASKERFDRAIPSAKRRDGGYPSVATIFKDEFFEATTDLWEDIAPESATRVGHPAPFPVEIPKRLIELYTYKEDLVLDPFIGSGTTAIAAVRTDRYYVGYDTDGDYLDVARNRITVEEERLRDQEAVCSKPFRVELGAVPTGSADRDDDFQSRAVREGRMAKELAVDLLVACGFSNLQPGVRLSEFGVEVNFVAQDQQGYEWAFDVSGAFTSSRAGLRRTDTLWKALGKASVLHQAPDDRPLVLITSDAPQKGSAGYRALEAVRGPGKPIFDLIELLNPDDQDRLHSYAVGGRPDR
jgi:DNA modification methylase